MAQYLARLFPAGSQLWGEVLLWSGPPPFGPPVAILSFWPAGVAVPASGAIDGQPGRWHLEYAESSWQPLVALLASGPVMLVTAAGEPHLSTAVRPVR